MRYFALLLAACLTGCATTAKYEAILNTWKGSSTDDLILKWGPPVADTALSDGRHVLRFSSSSTSATTSYDAYTKTAYTTPSTSWCNTDFITKDGKIITWKWEGNSCRSR